MKQDRRASTRAEKQASVYSPSHAGLALARRAVRSRPPARSVGRSFRPSYQKIKELGVQAHQVFSRPRDVWRTWPGHVVHGQDARFKRSASALQRFGPNRCLVGPLCKIREKVDSMLLRVLYNHRQIRLEGTPRGLKLDTTRKLREGQNLLTELEVTSAP